MICREEFELRADICAVSRLFVEVVVELAADDAASPELVGGEVLVTILFDARLVDSACTETCVPS